jgi:F-type H+-transporting ATPase subunit b
MELLKMLSANELVAQTISFLILLFLLKRLAWKPVLKILDDRKNRIESEFKEIDELKADAERIKTDYEARIAVIEKTAREKIETGVNEGRRMAEVIKEAASKDAERIIEDARDVIKDETGRARETLKEEIIDITISAAEKIIAEKVMEKHDRKAVEEFLQMLDKKKKNGW